MQIFFTGRWASNWTIRGYKQKNAGGGGGLFSISWGLFIGCILRFKDRWAYNWGMGGYKQKHAGGALKYIRGTLYRMHFIAGGGSLVYPEGLFIGCILRFTDRWTCITGGWGVISGSMLGGLFSIFGGLYIGCILLRGVAL